MTQAKAKLDRIVYKCELCGDVYEKKLDHRKGFNFQLIDANDVSCHLGKCYETVGQRRLAVLKALGINYQGFVFKVVQKNPEGKDHTMINGGYEKK